MSLWFVLRADRAPLHPDPGEFTAVRWLRLDDRAEWAGGRFDPQMGRFIGKLTAALKEHGRYRSGETGLAR
jgi:hypothetical protein